MVIITRLEYKLKSKYVVKDVVAGKYLTDSYYRTSGDNCLSYFLEDAHEFTAFELKLASVTRLNGKIGYRVYKLKKIKEEEVLFHVK
jgi:hypothetical protein